MNPNRRMRLPHQSPHSGLLNVGDHCRRCASEQFIPVGYKSQTKKVQSCIRRVLQTDMYNPSARARSGTRIAKQQTIPASPWQLIIILEHWSSDPTELDYICRKKCLRDRQIVLTCAIAFRDSNRRSYGHTKFCPNKSRCGCKGLRFSRRAHRVRRECVPMGAIQKELRHPPPGL